MVINEIKMQKTLARPAVSATLSTMNIAKLVRRNLSLPMSQRVSVNTIRRRVASGMAYARGQMLALQAQIHVEIAPQIAAMRNAELALSREKRCEE